MLMKGRVQSMMMFIEGHFKFELFTHVIVIRAARKLGRKQKGGRSGVGEGKDRNACTQTPRF